MAQREILIVDDDANTRLMLNARLKAKNYEIVFAGDSYQAVSAARKEQSIGQHTKVRAVL